MSSSLSHFITAGLAGLPGPAMLFPLGQGTTGAARGSRKGVILNSRCAICSSLWPGPALPALGPIHPEPSPQQLLFVPPPFSILTKALYRIILITFRC